MKGIVLPVPAKYEELALRNIRRLRKKYSHDVPIEIWEIGNEISLDVRAQLLTLGPISFRNVMDHTPTPSHWKGFQIKAFAARYTAFEQMLLCDADLTFLRNPLHLFAHAAFRETGTYFFRDLAKWKYRRVNERGTDEFSSYNFYRRRRDWLLGLMPEPPTFFPREWRHLYSSGLPAKPVNEAYMESGAVFLDRRRHPDILETVYRLNENHEETYRCIMGDKETWWIACCMCNKAFSMNLLPPLIILRRLTQFYHYLPFYRQK
jgi:alpha 1,3-mannosyltransferase